MTCASDGGRPTLSTSSASTRPAVAPDWPVRPGSRNIGENARARPVARMDLLPVRVAVRRGSDPHPWLDNPR